MKGGKCPHTSPLASAVEIEAYAHIFILRWMGDLYKYTYIYGWVRIIYFRAHSNHKDTVASHLTHCNKSVNSVFINK